MLIYARRAPTVIVAAPLLPPLAHSAIEQLNGEQERRIQQLTTRYVFTASVQTKLK